MFSNPTNERSTVAFIRNKFETQRCNEKLSPLIRNEETIWIFATNSDQALLNDWINKQKMKPNRTQSWLYFSMLSTYVSSCAVFCAVVDAALGVVYLLVKTQSECVFIFTCFRFFLNFSFSRAGNCGSVGLFSVRYICVRVENCI